MVGTTGQVADAMEAWVAETDVDGFNPAHALMPGILTAIADHPAPELQRRGRCKRDYAEGAHRRAAAATEERLGSGEAA